MRAAVGLAKGGRSEVQLQPAGALRPRSAAFLSTRRDQLRPQRNWFSSRTSLPQPLLRLTLSTDAVCPLLGARRFAGSTTKMRADSARPRGEQRRDN